MVSGVPLRTGLTASVQHRVADTDTASAIGSGIVDVLATPVIVTLVERAACAALEGHLDDATTTVGFRVQVDHLKPSAPGSELCAEATLERAEGRRLTFAVAVRDDRGLVAAGRITRVIVETDRFLDRALD